MPLYEYQCPDCGRFERIQKFADAPLTTCPNCGQAVQRLLSAPAIQFKGSGWYITDYARKDGAGKGEKPSATAGETKSEGAKADGASASKSAGSSTSNSGAGSSS